jgi:hypothetical protein
MLVSVPLRHARVWGRLSPAILVSVIASASKAIRNVNRGDGLDCFVACAPLRKRFAFVAGNDASPRSRALTAPELLSQSPPKEGAGNAGCPLHPQPHVQVKEARKCSHHRFIGNHPTLPAQWFYGL